MEFLFWLNVVVLAVMSVIGIYSFFSRFHRETLRNASSDAIVINAGNETAA